MIDIESWYFSQQTSLDCDNIHNIMCMGNVLDGVLCMFWKRFCEFHCIEWRNIPANKGATMYLVYLLNFMKLIG